MTVEGQCQEWGISEKTQNRNSIIGHEVQWTSVQKQFVGGSRNDPERVFRKYNCSRRWTRLSHEISTLPANVHSSAASESSRVTTILSDCGATGAKSGPSNVGISQVQNEGLLRYMQQNKWTRPGFRVTARVTGPDQTSCSVAHTYCARSSRQRSHACSREHTLNHFACMTASLQILYVATILNVEQQHYPLICLLKLQGWQGGQICHFGLKCWKSCA
ncbi:hypothetical protein Mp_1g24550 [Marchantia polymorpha subsp. ruderalis]|uniref:Uncharacterized protein n=2 Tax=Marchantia polymorpha TaxID=3197 RepID=A0AAF6ATV4_MARPO|nr:hypothetical protein MARPO_0061s0067 [Marchantia polymorpha]BBM99874.1 hypothetical protein Mp_1g24550 [Marchantia polymorpha subsp. ruderalis]|eukprot:PTQ36811.1 hypothetical protein MARPO_0061s0067 [Marchantia polymorpha]